MRPHRSWCVQLVLLIGRWAGELLFAAVLVVMVCRIHASGVYGDGSYRGGWPWWAAVLAVLVAVLVPFVIPQTRPGAVGLFWMSVTRHRLRTFFIECRIFNASGKLPWMLFVRPTPVGERVWIWLVPGLSIDDFERSTEDIAAALWARTTRVERHTAIGALVRLDIVRRDPLTRAGVIPSHLVPADTAATEAAEAAQAAHMGGNGEEELDIPAPAFTLDTSTPSNDSNDETPGSLGDSVKHRARAEGRTRKPNETSAVPTGQSGRPALVSLDGEDVSDYV